MKNKFYGKVLENKKIAADVWDMHIHLPEAVSIAKAGQFISIYTGDATMLLPRPLSICEINHSREVLRIVYRVVGQGTEKLSELMAGDEVTGLAPLGSFYHVDPTHQKFAIVGGGMGTPPMLGLVHQIRQTHPNAHISVYLGFGKKSQIILADDFETCADKVVITTDDGSFGLAGNVVQNLPENPDFDAIFGCGPHVMLEYLAKYAENKGLPCHISLEERMACSIGACLACVAKTTNGLRRICKTGPVFDAKEVLWR